VTFNIGDRVQYSKRNESFEANIVAFSSSRNSAKFKLDDGSFLTKKIRYCTAIEESIEEETPQTQVIQNEIEEEEEEEEEEQVVLTDEELRDLQSTLGLSHLSIQEVRIAYENKTLF